jgi:hypothetical protein
MPPLSLVAPKTFDFGKSGAGAAKPADAPKPDAPKAEVRRWMRMVMMIIMIMK